MQIRKELFGEKNNEVATSYANIGATYNQKYEYDLALEYYLKSIQVYPNPAQNSIYIQNGQNSRALIYNLQGLQLLTMDLSSASETLDISHINAGVYILKIETKVGVVNKKISILK